MIFFKEEEEEEEEGRGIKKQQNYVPSKTQGLPSIFVCWMYESSMVGS